MTLFSCSQTKDGTVLTCNQHPHHQDSTDTGIVYCTGCGAAIGKPAPPAERIWDQSEPFGHPPATCGRYLCECDCGGCAGHEPKTATTPTPSSWAHRYYGIPA